MPPPDISLLTPREQLRADLRDRLVECMQVVSGGPWDGRRVVAEEDVENILTGQLDPPSGHGAEVRTPARVVVAADCPKCRLPATISLEISSELRVDAASSTLRLKGKSKEATHVCGQTVMDLADGQEAAWDIGEITGAVADAYEAKGHTVTRDEDGNPTIHIDQDSLKDEDADTEEKGDS
jgi:hypothetical protein